MQSESLSPDRAILSNVIRQGEKVRVGEKGGGFMVIERTSISHCPFKGLPQLVVNPAVCSDGYTGLSELQRSDG